MEDFSILLLQTFFGISEVLGEVMLQMVGNFLGKLLLEEIVFPWIKSIYDSIKGTLPEKFSSFLACHTLVMLLGAAL